MKFSEYIIEVNQRDFARNLGVSAQQVSHWRSGFRPVPLEHCAAVERVSGGQVMRWDLRPDDWWLIWPELLGRPDAPKLTTAA